MYGLSSMQGWRLSMEDAHASVLDLKTDDKTESTVEDRVSFFGVYDGHGGKCYSASACKIANSFFVSGGNPISLA